MLRRNLPGRFAVIKGNLKGAVFLLPVILQGNGKVEPAVFIAVYKGGIRKEIPYADFFFGIKINIPVNTAEEPHILVLKVGAVGVSVNLGNYAVLAGHNIIRNIKLRRGH